MSEIFRDGNNVSSQNMPLIARKLLTNTAQFKYWFMRSCFPLKPTANTAERMHWRPVLNSCEFHDQDLTLLGSWPTTITTQIYFTTDHCPDLLLLQSKPPTITTRPTTITFQPYNHYDTHLLLLRPESITISLKICSFSMGMKTYTHIFCRWIRLGTDQFSNFCTPDGRLLLNAT
jgi:hypothetical protein